jgi:translocation and assembly module TamB
LKPTNKVLIAFLILVGGTFVGLFNTLQTERFAQFLTKKINKNISKNFKGRIKFENLEIGVFPPRTILKNISIASDNNDFNFKAEGIGAYFGLFDLFGKEFSVGQINVENGDLNINKLSAEKIDYKLNISFLYSLYQNKIYKNLPFKIKEISLNKFQVNRVGKNEVAVHDLSMGIYKNIFTVKGELHNLDLEEFTGWSDLKTDMVKVNLQLTNREIFVKEFNFKRSINDVRFSGKINRRNEIDGVLGGTGEVNYFYKLYRKFKNTTLEDAGVKGYVELKSHLSGSISDPNAKIELRALDLNTKYFKSDFVQLNAVKEKSIISIEKIRVERNKGVAELIEKVKVYNFKNDQIIWPSIKVQAESIHTNDFLYFLPSLNIMKARVSGLFDIDIDSNNIVINIKNEKAVAKNFTLGDSTKPILKNDKIEVLKGSFFNISLQKSSLETQARLKIGNSEVEALGEITGKGLNIEVNESKINFKDIGPIVGIDFEGQGEMDFTISGPYKEIVFNFNPDIKDFSFLNFNLGHVKGEFSLLLPSVQIKIKELLGKYLVTEYSAFGDLNFKNEEPLDLSFSVNKGTLRNLEDLLPIVFSASKKYLKFVSSNISGSFKMEGGFTGESVRIFGVSNAENIIILGEDFDKASLKFSFLDKKLKLKNIWIKKVSGFVRGNLDIDVKNRLFKYQLDLAGIKLRDLNIYRAMNLGYDGELIAELYGQGAFENFSSRSHFRIVNGSIENYKVSDSVLTIYNKESDLFASGKFLGGDAYFDSYIDFSKDKNKKKRSFFKMSLDSKEPRLILGILSSHNIHDKNIRGEIKANAKFELEGLDLTKMDLEFNLKKATFNKGNVNVNITKPIQLLIEKGKIKKWSWDVRSKGLRSKGVGKGNLYDKFLLDNEVEGDASLISLISNRIQYSSGKVLAKMKLVGNLEEVNKYATLVGKDLQLKVAKVPGTIAKLNFDMLLDNKRFHLKKLSALYGGGTVSGKGMGIIRFPFPTVDLDFNFNKNRINFFKKSGVMVSGKAKLQGARLPYDLNGNVSILNGEFFDDLNDLIGNAIESNSYERFMPRSYLDGGVGLISNNINISIFQPIHIKNGLADMKLTGDVNILGTLTRPLLQGKITLAGQDSKLIFKSHEFHLSDGTISFNDKQIRQSPDLYFNGMAKVNEYDVYVSVRGAADSLNVEMGSNPSLGQEDILSLLTLGVTNDVSKNLGEEERQSVTTLSIGSLLVDQLKINQNLNDSLGVRLSVQPEISEDETSLLDGRIDEGSSSSSRLRSGTRIKVQKKISSKVNASVSSTVGGTIEQKQEMNVNLNINKNMSLEGVYEIRNSDEVETDSTNSFGADLKFRWSF